MRTAFLLLLLLPALPSRAGPDALSALVARLFDEDPAVRAEARAAIAAREDVSVDDLLRAIEARQGETGRLRIYDVRDLEPREPWWTAALEGLRALVPDGIQVHEGTLVVNASAEAHARIAERLKELRHDLGGIVSLEVRVVRLHAGAEVPASLAGDEVTAFVDAQVERDLAAPRLTCYEGQRANVSVLSQVSYVSDFDFRVEGASVIADPVVDVLNTGMIADLRASVAGEGTVQVALTAAFTEVSDPIPTMKLRLPFGEAVEIQVPETTTRKLTRVVTCPAGRVAVVRLGDRDAVLLRASAGNLEDCEAGPERDTR